MSTSSTSPGKSSSLTSWIKGLKNSGAGSTNSGSNLASKDSEGHTQQKTVRSQNADESAIASSADAATPKSAKLQTSMSASLVQPRPKLGYRSRSSHTFRPLSTYFGSTSSSNEGTLSTKEKLKLQKDNFIMQRQMDNIGNSAVFGVSLEESVRIAEGKIYISSDSDGLVVYGRIPRVVAFCGLFLKKNALDVEGIFRVAGSNKRIKQLQIIFSTAPDYGAKIDWDGFTVHDAASLLRRYLGALPEPLIPLALYEDFREPLRSHPAILKYLKDKEIRMSHVGEPAKRHATASSDDKGHLTPEERRQKRKMLKKKLTRERNEALNEYAHLFDKLPELNRQLLFYILDLLAIFNMHSDENRMPARNLAAIFQPSILSHSDHDLSPDEYALSSLVVEFMIQYSHKILPAAQESARIAAAAAASAKKHSKKRVNDSGNSPEDGNVGQDPKNRKDSKNLRTSSQAHNSSLSLTIPRRKHSKSMSYVQGMSDMIRVAKPTSDSSSIEMDDEEISGESGEKFVDSAETLAETKSDNSAENIPLSFASEKSEPTTVITPPINIEKAQKLDVAHHTSKTPKTPKGQTFGAQGSQSPSRRFLHTLAKPLNILSSPRLHSQSPEAGIPIESVLSPSDEKELGNTPLLESGSPTKEKKGWLNKLRSRSNSKSVN